MRMRFFFILILMETNAVDGVLRVFFDKIEVIESLLKRGSFCWIRVETNFEELNERRGINFSDCIQVEVYAIKFITG